MSKITKTAELHFPVKGLVRRYAYQSQPPYTTPDALNVRPYDVLDGRERGGTRPGLTKAYAAQPNGTNPFQSLVGCVGNNATGALERILVAIVNGKVTYSANGAAFADATGDLADQLNADAVSIQTVQYRNTLYIAEYRQTAIGGSDGVLTAASKYLDAASVSDWTALGLDADLDVIYITGLEPELDGYYAITDISAGQLTIAWPSAYTTGTVEILWGIVTLTGGTWPYWAAGGKITVASTSYDVATRDSDTQLTLTDLTACHPRRYRTGTVAMSDVYYPDPDDHYATQGTLSGGTWPDWFASGDTFRVGDLVLPINYVSSGLFYIYPPLTTTWVQANPAFDEWEIVEAGGGQSFSLAAEGGNCSWQVHHPAKMLNLETLAVSDITASDGQEPSNHPIVGTHQNRLVFAGPGDNWAMSREGDDTDWQYGATDDNRPITSDTFAGGRLGSPILAIIPFMDNRTIFACESSIWILTGNPAANSVMESLTREFGIVGQNAWCALPDGSVMVLGRGGLYRIPAGGINLPIPFSRETLPGELLDVDADANAVSLAFDSQKWGIHITVTPTTGETGQHWWIDWQLEGLWPVRLPLAMQPTALCAFAADASAPRRVLLGCHDGYIRYYDENAADDDGTDIESYVEIGPIRLGPPLHDGILTEIAAALGTGSADLTWSIYTGESAEDTTLAGEPADTGTWEAGRNAPEYLRISDAAALIALDCSSGQWAVEYIVITVAEGGRTR
jgi:hypothetical protein